MVLHTHTLGGELHEAPDHQASNPLLCCFDGEGALRLSTMVSGACAGGEGAAGMTAPASGPGVRAALATVHGVTVHLDGVHCMVQWGAVR